MNTILVIGNPLIDRHTRVEDTFLQAHELERGMRGYSAVSSSTSHPGVWLRFIPKSMEKINFARCAT
ncbi:MAG: hypothetical protein S4CHLAM123_08320 [Chlamydiales bacterium]|nr:hypothetical protein [Chlamydiales bacterium]